MSEIVPPPREPSPVEAVSVYGGYRAKFRKSTGGFDYVQVNGIPQVYPTMEAAELAAWQAREKHFHGHGILSTGEKNGAGRFDEIRKVFPGHGRRPFDVEVRR